MERTVGVDDQGMRFDTFLAKQPEVGRRSLAKTLIQSGAAWVNDRVYKPSHALEKGQVIRFILSAETLGEEQGRSDAWDVELKILFEDAYVLVIDKPIGLIAHRANRSGPVPPNIADLALAHCGSLPTLGGEDRPGIVHRLDRDTSGVMVIAKEDEAYHFLKSQFKARTVAKEYHAIGFGEARFDSDHIERNLTTHPRQGDRMVVTNDGGKAASTYYEVIRRFSGYTYFRCRPRTGRTHQIRVHLTSVGHSLVGDRVYRSRNASTMELPADAPDPGRQCLHACRLGFEHPRTREPLTFEAPVPDDMRALLVWLEKHRAK